MMPNKFIAHYKLQKYIVNGYIYAVVKKTMYGLPQAGKISHQMLVTHLAPYGYKPSNIHQDIGHTKEN